MATRNHRVLTSERLDSRLLMTADFGEVFPVETFDDAYQVYGPLQAAEQTASDFDVDQNGVVERADAVAIVLDTK